MKIDKEFVKGFLTLVAVFWIFGMVGFFAFFFIWIGIKEFVPLVLVGVWFVYAYFVLFYQFFIKEETKEKDASKSDRPVGVM